MILDLAVFKWWKKSMIWKRLISCQDQMEKPFHWYQRIWGKGKNNSTMASFQKRTPMRYYWTLWIWRNTGKSRLESTSKLSPSTKCIVVVAIHSLKNIMFLSKCENKFKKWNKICWHSDRRPSLEFEAKSLNIVRVIIQEISYL